MYTCNGYAITSERYESAFVPCVNLCGKRTCIECFICLAIKVALGRVKTFNGSRDDKHSIAPGAHTAYILGFLRYCIYSKFPVDYVVPSPCPWFAPRLLGFSFHSPAASCALRGENVLTQITTPESSHRGSGTQYRAPVRCGRGLCDGFCDTIFCGAFIYDGV